MYIKEAWCKQYTVREQSCDPDLELLCLSMRPFYLPREFGNVIIIAAYVPPSGNAHKASCHLAKCVYDQL